MLRLAFFGTPDFAAACLRRLWQDGHEIAAVFAQPDKPRGRGYQRAATPVKAAALEMGLPVFEPVRLKDGAVAAQLRALGVDAAVVVAYGRLLPADILAAPRFGCINVHASLLPKFRGSAPIQWAVIRGEEVTGITCMQMDEGMDTGDILYTMETAIGPQETAGGLFDRLAGLGGEAISRTLSLLEAGRLSPIPQPEEGASYAPMLKKEDGRLDFTRPAGQLYNLIRGVSPWPGAHTRLDGKIFKVHEARVCNLSGEPGTLLEEKRLVVGCGQGALELTCVQLEGGKRQSGEEFLRGHRLKIGKKFAD